jgi:hypothetical protein
MPISGRRPLAGGRKLVREARRGKYFLVENHSELVRKCVGQWVPTSSLLHFFTSSLLHFFTSSLLHFFTSSLLHFSTSALQHFSTSELQNFHPSIHQRANSDGVIPLSTSKETNVLF